MLMEKEMGMLPACRRVRAISCGVLSTALIFLNLGERRRSKWAQWRGTMVKTGKNVAITTPHSKVRSSFPCSMISTQLLAAGHATDAAGLAFPMWVPSWGRARARL